MAMLLICREPDLIFKILQVKQYRYALSQIDDFDQKV